MLNASMCCRYTAERGMGAFLEMLEFQACGTLGQTARSAPVHRPGCSGLGCTVKQFCGRRKRSFFSDRMHCTAI